MQEILVPTDFSDNALNALHYAVAFAQKLEASITILHVYQQEEDQVEIQEKLQAIKNNLLADSQALPIQIHLVEGTFLKVLQAMLETKKYAYVIIGMKGKTAFEQVFIGSNTLNVLDNVQTPVIVIPKDAIFRPFRKVSLAIDTHNTYHFTTFEGLKKLLLVFRTNLMIVTVRMREAIESTEMDKLQMTKVKKWLGNELTVSLKAVVADSVSEGLLYYLAQKSDNDLLVMVARKRNFFEKVFRTSFSQQMAFIAEVPILIIYEE